MKRFVLPRALYGPFEEPERARAAAGASACTKGIPFMQKMVCEISVTRKS